QFARIGLGRKDSAITATAAASSEDGAEQNHGQGRSNALCDEVFHDFSLFSGGLEQRALLLVRATFSTMALERQEM
ncbi:MAG: hypothetical protein NXI11_12975, partial [Proteobacteria bacterium]|nr:hypothetical protein [Pseudomonadota bacterium]